MAISQSTFEARSSFGFEEQLATSSHLEDYLGRSPSGAPTGTTMLCGAQEASIAPDSTLWPLGEHTPGKHLVLRNYLNAWLPILGMTQSAEVKFVFVELEPDRAQYLERLVEAEKADLPGNCDALVVQGRFDATMTTLLDDIESKMKALAPCFLMVDPFGISGTPMTIIQRVLRHPKSEVYISFMYEAINRFNTTSEFAPHLDALFGCTDWRRGVEIVDAQQEKDFFYTLYRNQLKQAGARYVLHFELYQGGRLVYAIFFGTKHLLGCDRMKQAIWKVAPFGDYVFRGTRTAQLGLDLDAVDPAALANELAAAFKSAEWIRVEEANEFAQSDLTDYHSGHLKKALVHLETSKRIEIKAGSRKKVRTFPDGTRFRFK